jgi:hypothetical protein
VWRTDTGTIAWIGDESKKGMNGSLILVRALPLPELIIGTGDV